MEKEEFEKEVALLYRGGMKIGQISRKIGKTESFVKSLLKRQGEPLRKRQNLSGQELEDKVLELYNEQKLSIKDIKVKLKKSFSTIKEILKSHEITIRQSNSGKYYYSYNKDYFKTVDTHEKAFILGLWMTDGSVAKNEKSFSISLHWNDWKLLDDVRKQLSEDKSLSFYETKSGQKCVLTIHCEEMAKDLIRLGIVPNKTFKLKVEPWMLGEFKNSAILGLMAGDGSFSKVLRKNVGGKKLWRPYSNWVFSFVGLKPICEFIKKTFHEELGVHASLSPASKYKNSIEKPLCIVSVAGNLQSKRVMEWLHKDCSIFMQRKYNNYLDLVDFLEEKESRLLKN